MKKGGVEKTNTIYWANAEESEEVRKHVEQELEIAVKTSRIGPVLGSHSGPKVVGTAFVIHWKRVWINLLKKIAGYRGIIKK
jgi:fatty acid-binding protein DegV